MKFDNPVYESDLEYIVNYPTVSWDKFSKSKILITGSTGLIGENIVDAFIYADKKLNLNLHLYLIVRDIEKAKSMFEYKIESRIITYIEGDVENVNIVEADIDYVIHAASPTASRFFVNCPVETISTAVQGTINILNIAKENNVKAFAYLSSMEAYGDVSEEILLSEETLGDIDLTNCRSVYPESKRLCEILCMSYWKEYNLKTNNIRLAQTFGPGVKYDDKRVFAMMARSAMNKENIVLQTPGASKHPYLYTAQAVTAILTILLQGFGGETYNVANPETYCSVFEMANIVAEEVAAGGIKVEIAKNGDVSLYPKPGYLQLDISKVLKLGWKPEETLTWMYERLIKTM